MCSTIKTPSVSGRASNLTSEGQTVPNLVLAESWSGWAHPLQCPGATTHLIADLAGYFTYEMTGGSRAAPTRVR